MARVTRRLLPMLMLCYFVAYLDRVNIGFAGLTMNRDLGFSAAVFGFGGGIFFLGYFPFRGAEQRDPREGRGTDLDRPDTRHLGDHFRPDRLGSRPVFVLPDPFLTRAGGGWVFSGIILYLTWWFPSFYRSRITAVFMAAIPISNIIGSVVSGAILNLHGWLNLAGWQWLFILEAAPAVVLGVLFYLFMTDRPEHAQWLEPGQRRWLIERLAAERAQREAIRHYSLGEALRDRRVLLLSLVYFGGTYAGYGIVLFQPQIVRKLAEGYGTIGLINAIPYVFGVIAMILWGRHSDRTGERAGHTAIGCAVGAAGLIACGLMTDPVMTMAMLVVAAMGQSSTGPCFWSLPTAMLSGTAAAGGIALINALGNLGGFFGPYIFGLVRDAAGNFTLGLIAIALGPVVFDSGKRDRGFVKYLSGGK